MKHIEAILFDLGDTLIYFDGDWDETFLQAEEALFNNLQENGLKLGNPFLSDLRARLRRYYAERDDAHIETTSKVVLQQTLEDWGYQDLSEHIIVSALAAMYAVTQEHWLPEKDALPVLAALKKAGYRMAIISNAADEANTQKLIDKLGARQYFEAIVISAAAGIRKPDPSIFTDLLETMRLQPSQVVMVGDTLKADILGARNAGIFSIWLTRRVDNDANQSQRNQITPDATIGRLSDLPELLANL